jgi:hypothetical protein
MHQKFLVQGRDVKLGAVVMYDSISLGEEAVDTL